MVSLTTNLRGWKQKVKNSPLNFDEVYLQDLLGSRMVPAVFSVSEPSEEPSEEMVGPTKLEGHFGHLPAL